MLIAYKRFMNICSTSINIKRLALWISAVISCATISAQNSDSEQQPIASFVQKHIDFCDEGKTDIVVKLNMKGNTKASIFVTKPNGTLLAINDIYSPMDSLLTMFSGMSVNLRNSDDERYRPYLFTIDSVYTKATGMVHVNDTMLVEVWKTPTAKIVTPDNVCGFETFLEADGSWLDISSYTWSSTRGTLGERDSRLCSIVIYPQITTTATIYMVESTGHGKCWSRDVKDVTFTPRPSGTVTHLDEAGNQSNVVICSTTPDDEDSYVDCIFSLKGLEPLRVTMSDGRVYDDLPTGQSVQRIHITDGGKLYVQSVMDANYCISNEYGASTAGISVTDLKPKTTMPKDLRIYYQGESVEIEQKVTSTCDTHRWQLAVDNPLTSLTATDKGELTYANLISKIGGAVAVDYIETITTKGGKECSSTVEYLASRTDIDLADLMSASYSGTEHILVDGAEEENKENTINVERQGLNTIGIDLGAINSTRLNTAQQIINNIELRYAADGSIRLMAQDSIIIDNDTVIINVDGQSTAEKLDVNVTFTYIDGCIVTVNFGGATEDALPSIIADYDGATEIFDIRGRKLRTIMGDVDTDNLGLERGIYIIRQGDRTTKVKLTH